MADFPSIASGVSGKFIIRYQERKLMNKWYSVTIFCRDNPSMKFQITKQNNTVISKTFRWATCLNNQSLQVDVVLQPVAILSGERKCWGFFFSKWCQNFTLINQCSRPHLSHYRLTLWETLIHTIGVHRTPLSFYPPAV